MNTKAIVMGEMLEACAAAQDSRVLVHCDVRRPMAHAPLVKGFDRWNFLIAVGLRLKAPTVVDDFGITACLSFGGQYEIVRVPWDAVWVIEAVDPKANVEAYHDPECTPPEAVVPRASPVEAHPPQQAPNEPAAPLPANVVPFRRPG
jgi:hypothetical protein